MMCDFDDFGWEEMGMAGALAEEMAEEERERRRLERELEKENEECESCCNDYDPFDPPDEEPYP
jgi:hypothetical protein